MPKVLRLFSVPFVILCTVLFGLMVLAQDVTTPMPEQDYIDFLVKSIGGSQNVKGLALVALIVQVIMNTFRVPAVISLLGGKLKPVVQWTLVTFLNLLGTVLVLKGQNMSWAAIAVHAQTLMAWQVFYHQGYKLYLEKKVK